jgi:N-acyl-L-homoserine lactone synthetase
MSSNISRASSWYPSGVPLADSSGIDVISAVLKQVASDTSFEGKIMFPVLSLSRRKDLVREAAQLFPYSLKRQFRRWLPLPSNSDLQATLTTAVVAGNAEVSKRGSRYVWCLDIYEATPIFDREVRAQARLWTKPNICIKKLPPRQIGDGFTIRHATEADLKSLFKIRCEVFSGEQQRTFCLDEQAQIYTDHQDRFAENFVALDASGAIIGGIRMSMPSAGSVILPSRYAHLVSKLSPEADWAVLDRGCLKQGCRGGRLYRQMYQFVADFATSNNVKLLVGAIDRDNKALHAFHERMGWHVDPCEMPSTEYGLVSIVAKLLP